MIPAQTVMINAKVAEQIAERLLKHAEAVFEPCAYNGGSLDVWDLVEHLAPMAQRAAADEALRLIDAQVHMIVRSIMVQWLDELDWKRKDAEEREYFQREGHKSMRRITHEEAKVLWARKDAEIEQQTTEALRRVWGADCLLV